MKIKGEVQKTSLFLCLPASVPALIRNFATFEIVYGIQI